VPKLVHNWLWSSKTSATYSSVNVFFASCIRINVKKTVVYIPDNGDMQRLIHWKQQKSYKQMILPIVTFPKCHFAAEQYHWSFLARDSIYAIARYVLSPVCPSVCLSVRHMVDQSKTVKVRITYPSPQSSPMTLVSWRLTSPWNSTGKIGNGDAKWHRGSKNTQFSANKSPYLRNGAMTNRKWHMRFRLVPKSSTLDDPEWPWTAKTHSGAEKMRLLEPTVQIWIEDRPIHAATKM